MKGLMSASVVWLMVIAFSPNAWALEFHVAPTGKDDNSGTAEAPFASLVRAQQAVREAKKDAKPAEPVTVVIHSGVYSLTEPLVFEPQDSGTADAPVVYQAAPGEQVVLSGGQAITGWKKVDDRLWGAELPEVKAGEWRFRQLFVDGQSRPRARTPNTGFFRVVDPRPDGGPKVRYSTPTDKFGFKPGDLDPKWKNLQDVEVIVYHFWTDTHLPIQSVDTEKNVVTFANPSRKQFTDDFTSDGARYIVENLFEGLDEPGEWYLDRKAGMLYYWPKAGEDMTQVAVVAPRATALVEMRGEPEALKFVEHLAFRRLVFEFCHFELPAGEVNNMQASVAVSAAISLTGARHCAFENCEMKNLGAYAVELCAGCRDNTFVGNALHDLAAGGFRLNSGEITPELGLRTVNPLLRTAGNVISDNEIAHYGEIFPSAVGVLLMNTEDNTVAHNHIHHGYYTGVSIGWCWGYLRSISRDNHIDFNHIHHIGQGLLSDMGAIYTLGVSPGTTLRNNRIHDVEANRYGGWGIYHDEGSAHILVENNVVYRTKFAPFNIHYAKEVTVRNNVFAMGRIDQISRGRTEPHESVYFEGNIVYWNEGALFKGGWKDTPYEFHARPAKGKESSATRTVTFECDWNLYFNPTLGRDKVDFAGNTWAEWQKQGKDVHSQYADPKFVDVEHDDFRLKPDSPAWALGFRPIDMSQVGPRRRVGPSDEAP